MTFRITEQNKLMDQQQLAFAILLESRIEFISLQCKDFHIIKNMKVIKST